MKKNRKEALEMLVYKAKNNRKSGIFVTHSTENLQEACKVVERTLAKFNVEYEHPMSIETVDGVEMKAMAANDFHLKNGGRISVADGLQVEDFRVQEIVKLS
jgi:hypothetical protein